AFISGTPVPELQRMISSRLKSEHHLLANTGTHYAIARQEKAKTIYNHALTAEEKKEITVALEELIFHYQIQSLTTTEDQLQDRGSQITLSAIGRNAPAERKREFDPDGKKRLEWIAFLKQQLDEKKYELKIGGTTSIDITRKGLDKGWGIKTFLQHHGFSAANVVFFGDKIFPGGNDYAASKIVDCVAVKNPADTLRKLREIEITASTTDERPWGRFEQFVQNGPCSVKIIEIGAGKRLSLQSHQRREELLIALDDGVIAEVDGRRKMLLTGERVFIPKEAKHRLSAGEQPGRFLEISWGDFDEGDITRYEDDFGRA
ncbi:HAD-IIB family hydrolase, partial [Candidatus Woesearchaeota archaeon]|nr:HAD-IIB family hydrolase [Candidatus Woesearchaeota archaeon]